MANTFMIASLSPAALLVQQLLLWLSDHHGTTPPTSPMSGRELGSICMFPHNGNIIIFSILDVRE